MRTIKPLKKGEYGMEDHYPVKVRRAGHVWEIFYTSANSSGEKAIERIDEDHYKVIATGEILEFKHSNSRADRIDDVARSLAQGRAMINANIDDVSRARWLTLTYAENMRDPERLKVDFKHFNTRARKVFGSYEYIAFAEPQARGAWHLHVLMIFPGVAPFLPSDEIARLWKQGFVKVKRLDNVDNVGAYLSAYLSNLPVEEDVSTSDHVGAIVNCDVVDQETGEMKSKKFIKGARLKMYPPGFRIFRCSRGCKKPIEYETTYKRAVISIKKENESASSPVFSSAFAIDDNESSFKITIIKEQYNTRRKKKQV